MLTALSRGRKFRPNVFECTTLNILTSTGSPRIVKITAFILRRLRITTPRSDIELYRRDHRRNLSLADPTFYQSAGIELLLGAEAYRAILFNGVRRGLSHDLVAQETRLGWIITGNAQGQPNSGSRWQYSTLCSIAPDEFTLNETLQRFWELEELPESKVGSLENQLCERLFVEGHQRLSDRRYVVRLPRLIDITSEILGNTLRIALHSFNGTHRKMTRDSA